VPSFVKISSLSTEILRRAEQVLTDNGRTAGRHIGIHIAFAAGSSTTEVKQEQDLFNVL